MYASTLPKQQLKLVFQLMQKSKLARSVTCSSSSILETHYCSARAKSKSLKEQTRNWTTPPAIRQYCTAKPNHDDAQIPTAGQQEGTLAETAAATTEHPETTEEVDSFSLKTLLYDEMDEIMRILNASCTFENLLETMSQYDEHLQPKHLVQSIILMWIFFRQAHANALHDIVKHPSVVKTINNLKPHIAELSLPELSCCYLYLRKMGLPNTDPVLRNILMQALEAVDASSAPVVPLSVLSRLVIGINTEREFYTPMVCRNFMPHILQHIEKCQSAEDARLLAICMRNLHQLICEDTLNAFKVRVKELLSQHIINAETPRTVLKLLHMLNMPEWSLTNANLSRDLLLVMQPNIAHLSATELRDVCRIYQYILEPAQLTEPLMLATEKRLHENASSDALTCFIPFVEPRKREPLIAIFKQLLASEDAWSQVNASSNFFNILRGLKISDVRACDSYWERIIAEVTARPEEQNQLRFLRHCHRYMNFNNNLGGTYRNQPLERKLTQMAMYAIEYDGRIPSKFSRLAAFVMAYGQTQYGWKKFPNILLSKIITMSEQFSVTDCYLLSRGTQIALEMRFRFQTPSILGMQLATIDSILLGCAERHLSDEENLTISDINMIVRTLANRKTLKNSTIYQEAYNKYKVVDHSNLSSRTIRDMVYNFTANNFLVPEMLEAIFNYVEQNHEHITGDTLEKIISCSYNLGYTPQSIDVLDFAAKILMRDFNYMSGLSVVQACLALCYYKTIPDELINRVFCVQFIQRIEEEIQMCYSKATYPERVLNQVMQLNRTVCLDFPEANVPWFQQNFVEAQLSKKPIGQNKFSNDVKNLLEMLLKGQTYFRCNHVTPYGYQIDFVIHFDRDKMLIPAPVETTMLDRITKVAILLLKLDSFCANDLTALRGPESLKIKHLEMMGYKVLHINEHDWNSKYMNVPGAKANYLKCLLQITN